MHLSSAHFYTKGDGGVAVLEDEKPFYFTIHGVVGSGNLVCSPEDFSLFIRALYKGKLLSQKMHEIIFTPFLSQYGGGILVEKEMVWHAGIINGTTTYAAYYPQKDITLMVSARTGRMQPLAHAIHQLIVGKKEPLPVLDLKGDRVLFIPTE